MVSVYLQGRNSGTLLIHSLINATGTELGFNMSEIVKAGLLKQFSANDRDLCKSRTAIFGANRRSKHLIFCRRNVEQNSSHSIPCMFMIQYYHQSFPGNFPLSVQEQSVV